MSFKKHALALLFALICASGANAVQPMKPGIYTETVHGNNGNIEVRVELTETGIKSVAIGENVETPYIAAEPMKAVAEAAVRGQTLTIDSVSGATQATGAVLLAIGQAIEKAGGDPNDFMKSDKLVDPAKLPLVAVDPTDVVVIGAGGTGLSAAASAAQHGAKVVVLEKMGVVGGSSALAGGAIAGAGTKFQKAAGIEDSPESFAELWLAEQERSIPGGDKSYPVKERIEKLAQASAATVEWLADEIGLKFAPPRPFGFGGPLRAHAPEAAGIPKNGRGSNPAGGRFEIEALKKYCDAHGVQIRTNTPAYELMQDESGRIVGVKAHDGKNRYEFKANAVVLATGGFARNMEMIADQAPRWTVYVQDSVAGKGSMGDGIVMAKKVGAVQSRDSWMIGLYLKPAYPALNKVICGPNKYKEILLVNERGQRFVREDLPYVTDAVADQREVWVVIDSSDEEKVKIVKDYLNYGIAVHGKDYRELARRMGANAYRFEETMQRFNEDAKKGVDTQFGKEKKYLYPVDKAPFYAVKVTPVAGGTLGGIVTNDKFEVLNAKGDVIPGLYAGGEMANRPYYNRVYTSGTGLAIAYTSGRMIGAEAAKGATK